MAREICRKKICLDECTILERKESYMKIKGIQYLTDLDGMGLREQIITYMEQKYGIEYARNLAGMTGEWEEVEIQEKEAKENQNQSIEEMKQMSEEMEKDHQEEIENPFDCMEQIEANGIISYVLPKDKRLSGKEINRDRQVSVRIRVAGRGNFPSKKKSEWDRGTTFI